MSSARVKPAIRELVPADIPVLQEIEKASFPEPLALFVLRQFIDLAGPLGLVAQVGGSVRGYILSALDHSAKSAWILSIAVHPEARHHGLAGALTKELLTGLKQRGLTEALLTVRPNNKPVLRLCEKHGFEEMRLDEHYFGPGEARLVMRKTFV